MNFPKSLFLDCFRTQKPDLAGLDFDDPWVSCCDWIRDSPDAAKKYIRYQFSKAKTDSDIVELAYEVRHCALDLLSDLREYEVDPTYPLYALGEYYQTNTAEAIRLCERCAQNMLTIIQKIEDQQRLLSVETGSIPFTKQQMVMIFVISMEAQEHGVQHGGNINQLAFAKMLHVALKIPWPEKDQNSTILKYIKSFPHFGRTRVETTIEDLNTIRPFFESARFSKAVEIVDREIVRCKKMERLNIPKF